MSSGNNSDYLRALNADKLQAFYADVSETIAATVASQSDKTLLFAENYKAEKLANKQFVV